VDVKDLKKKAGDSRLPRRTAVASLIKVMLKIYKANETQPHLPGDLRDMLIRAKRSKKDANHFPCLRSLIALAKYAPYRNALTKAAKSHEKQFLKSVPGVRGVGVTFSPSPKDYKVTAKILYDILVLTSRLVNGKSKSELAAWARNIGKGVHHHHGFVPLLVSLGVVKRSPRGQVHLGAERVNVSPWGGAVERRLTQFLHHTHTVESEVSKVMGKAKRGRLHIKDILEAKRKIAKRKCFTMYHGNWHLRALLLSSMHQNNFKVQVKWGLLCTRARKSQKKAPKQFQARQTRNARNENEPGSKAHKLHNRCPGSTSSLSKSLAL